MKASLILLFGVFIGANAQGFPNRYVAPVPPKITKAVLSKEGYQHIVSVDWMLTGSCSGIIDRYALMFSCRDEEETDREVTSGPLDFHCSSGNRGPTIKSHIPDDCDDGGDIYLRLRIGDANSMSEPSEPFLVRRGGLPLIAIIGIIVGAILLAIIIGLLVFFFCCRRHAKNQRNMSQSYPAQVSPEQFIPVATPNSYSNGQTAIQKVSKSAELGTPRELYSTEIKYDAASVSSHNTAGYSMPKY